MEERIKSRYSPEILAQAARRYGVSDDALEELDGFESFIYAFEKSGERYILRIAHSLRRSEALIRGEVDWINYLVGGGVGASEVILSEDRKLVEAIPDGQGEFFLATVFEYAPGIPPRDFGWDEALYRSLGMTMGRMHRLTKAYQHEDPQAVRPQWDDPIMLVDRSWMPKTEEIAWKKYAEIVDWCCTLPRSKDDYGLVHFDLHGGNFFVDGTGMIRPFDFDDCHYSWFSYDVAIALFYVVKGAENEAEFALDFMRHFSKGSQLENDFNPVWLSQLPVFMKMREIDLFAGLR